MRVTERASAGAVPVVDVAPFLAGTGKGKRAVSRQIAAACADIGFFTIAGHGVSADGQGTGAARP